MKEDRAKPNPDWVDAPPDKFSIKYTTNMIRQTKEGYWIIDGDTHVSAWVEQSGRLDHDFNTLARLCGHLRPGDTVIDCGAFIGDHTIAYANAVGPQGKVIAIEANDAAFACLYNNLGHYNQVACLNCGVSDQLELISLIRDSNAGASYATHDLDDDPVHAYALDDLFFYRFEHNGILAMPLIRSLKLLKMDIEGYEVRALRGAKKLIEAYRPILFLESNEGALLRAGTSRKELMDLISSLGYVSRIFQDGVPADAPQYDIICHPTT